MFLAHSFRLRDPWQCEASESGGVRWSRLFHRPTGLEPDDALWLVVSGLPADAKVTFNGEALTSAADGAAQFEVTALLTDANRIEIHIPSDLQPPVSSLQPAPFPYDARLGVVGHS